MVVPVQRVRRLEEVDVAIVGGRCAGSATAAVLARAGRRVLVIDRAAFPSDTLSTHAMFPSGLAELERIGAWPRIRDGVRPAKLTHVQVDIDGEVRLRERWQPVLGIDHGASIPRNLFDVHLVENARERGADVRERCVLDRVLWEHGRVAGLIYRDPDGELCEVRAPLVVGADGRRSAVAAGVGAWHPYRASKNGRGLVFRYMDDPRAGEWESRTMWQWRDGESFAFAFPNPGGRMICLFMGAADEVGEARADPDGYWSRKLAEHPGCAARIAGATNPTKLRSTADVVAFWRASSGPGWVLAGDAAHFKDPVTGQGMGDALRMGRTLGEAVAPLLDDPVALDRATRRWERETQRHCRDAYHLANLDTRVEAVSPIFREAAAIFARDEEPSLSHLFNRTRPVEDVMRPPILARAYGRALARGPGRLRTLRLSRDLLRTQVGVMRELAADRFRETGPVPGSDHPGWEFWEAPRP